MAIKSKTSQSSKPSLIKGQAAIRYTLGDIKDICLEIRSTDDFKLEGGWDEESNEIDFKGVSIAYKHGIQTNSSRKSLSTIFKVRYRYLDKYVLVQYGIKIDFILSDYDDVITHSSDGIPNLPEAFLVSIFGITISTARGVLASHLRGTEYSDIHVPIFYPNEIFEKFVKQYSDDTDMEVRALDESAVRKAGKRKK